MGILIQDTISLDNGLSANNTYGSFGDSTLSVEKITLDPEIDNHNRNFRVTCRGSIWTSKEYRDTLKPRIKTVSIRVDIEESQLGSNLYQILYTNWKSMYTNVSDSDN